MTEAIPRRGLLGSMWLAGHGTARVMRVILKSPGTRQGGECNKNMAPLEARSPADGTSMAQMKAPGSLQAETTVRIAARTVALDVTERPDSGPPQDAIIAHPKVRSLVSEVVERTRPGVLHHEMPGHLAAENRTVMQWTKRAS